MLLNQKLLLRGARILWLSIILIKVLLYFLSEDSWGVSLFASFSFQYLLVILSVLWLIDASF